MEDWSDVADDDFNETFHRDALDPDFTMIEAAGIHGGGLNSLARHAAAAYANA